MDADGVVRDPGDQQILTWDRTKPRRGQWDMGHKPGHEYWRIYQQLIKGEISLESFFQEVKILIIIILRILLIIEAIDLRKKINNE